MNRKDIENLRSCFNDYKGEKEYFNKLHSAIQNIEASFELDQADERINMPKQKRYRLVIPENVPNKYMSGWDCLYYLNGREVELIGVMTTDGICRFKYSGSDFNCPGSWLVEIQESRPCTAEELFKQHFPNKDTDSYTFNGFIKGLEIGAEQNELKHRETDTFQEWNNKTLSHENEMMTAYEHRKLAWKAANKSRGYDDQT